MLLQGYYFETWVFFIQTCYLEQWSQEVPSHPCLSKTPVGAATQERLPRQESHSIHTRDRDTNSPIYQNAPSRNYKGSTHPHSWKFIGPVDLVGTRCELFCTEFTNRLPELCRRKKKKYENERPIWNNSFTRMSWVSMRNEETRRLQFSCSSFRWLDDKVGDWFNL